jgi:hypothetical protein
MIRIVITALALLLSSAVFGSTTASFAQQDSTKTTAACSPKIQKLAFVAPELICRHFAPKATSHQKAVA